MDAIPFHIHLQNFAIIGQHGNGEDLYHVEGKLTLLVPVTNLPSIRHLVERHEVNLKAVRGTASLTRLKFSELVAVPKKTFLTKYGQPGIDTIC